MSTDERQRIERDIKIYTSAINTLVEILYAGSCADQLEAAGQLPTLLELRTGLEVGLEHGIGEVAR